MGVNYPRAGIPTVIGFFLLATIVYSQGIQSSNISPFSTNPEGSSLPAGWEPLTFKKVSQTTDYRLVKDEGVLVVKATSNGTASGLTNRVDIDLREYPILEWRWKVLNVISKGDVRTKEGDDYPARIYVTFEYDPDKVDWRKKTKYKLGKLLFGDIPIAAINYIWDNRTPQGAFVDNAFTDLVKMIVVESGEGNVGTWVHESRNVYQDFVKAFGEEPTRVNGIAIMTDTDNTGETATAFYGDIQFKRDPRSTD